MKIFIAQLIIICIMFSTVPSVAENSSPNIKVLDLLAARMDQTRHRKKVTSKREDILAADPHFLLKALAPFEQDSSPHVRWEAYSLEWSIGMQRSSRDVRQEVVERLSNACKDPEPLVWQYASERLLSFTAKDFTENAKKTLRQQLNRENPRGEMILVIGIADLRDQIPLFKRLRAERADYESAPVRGRWHRMKGWYVRLALARMGNNEDIEHCIEMIESNPNDVIRMTVLLRDLAYIRQPETIKVLQKYLESDETLGGEGDVLKSWPCQRALGLLAEILEDFPIKSKGTGGYTPEEIETARMWMKTQTTFKIKR